MAIADSILMEMDMETKTTQRVLDRVPEDKLTWKPHPTSHSLGQLAMHIAIVQGRIAAAATEDVHELGSTAPPQPKSHREILDAFSTGTAKAREVVKGFDDTRMMSTWTLKRNGKVLMSVPRVGCCAPLCSIMCTTIVGSLPCTCAC